MDDPRESDIFATNMDLIDLSRRQESLLLSDTANSTDQTENPSVNQLESIAGTTMSRGGGFCVKEYEDQLDNLTKENFNLKLRIYYLEQNNPSMPKDVESLMQQVIDLKVKNETISKDLSEKNDLLCQASKALELMETTKQEEDAHVQEVVEDLKERIALLESENQNLQHALSEAHNKTNLANDTGFTDFVGALEAKDGEIQRKMIEMTQHSDRLQNKVNDMEILVKQLEAENMTLSQTVTQLELEKDEIRNRIQASKTSSNEMTQNLEIELNEYKEKWASSECDLHDMRVKYQESEEERQKTLKFLESTLKTLAETDKKAETYEALLKQSQSLGKSDAKKDIEIVTLKREVEEMKRKLQEVTTKELQAKNQEIERLTELINSLRVERYSVSSEPPRFSFDYLYETFNDLKFQQAMEIKKQSQQKIDQLMTELEGMASAKSYKQLEQLKVQMAIVAEKQQITDTALGRCTELCAFTLDHLQELTKFLTALLQNKEFRESLSEASFLNIQHILEKSMDISHRQSMGNFSFHDISSLDDLVNAARMSIANIKEVQHQVCTTNKGMQTEFSSDAANTSAVSENRDYEELKRVNQVLEDEIVDIKSAMRIYEKKSNEYKSENAELKSVKDSLNERLSKSENTIKMLVEESRQLQLQCDDYKIEVESLKSKFSSLRDELLLKTASLQECIQSLSDANEDLQKAKTKNLQLESQFEFAQKTIQTLEVAKLKYESMWKESDEIAKKLETRLKHIEHDLEDNWLPKNIHEMKIKEMQEEIVNAESQTEAIRMELEKVRTESKLMMFSKSSFNDNDDGKENDQGPSRRRTIEISEDRKKLLMDGEESSSSCSNCDQYQKKVIELKKHLQAAIAKIKHQEKMKKIQEIGIEKQINESQSVMQHVRTNLESILKEKNKQ